MRIPLALLALVIPLAAAAEDDVEAPPEEASVVDEASVEQGPITSPSQTTTTTTTTNADGTTTTTTTTAAPGAVAPIARAAAAPVVHEDPCGAYKSARWRDRMRGRISIGFSKSHVHGKDAEGDEFDGSQKSFVARLNGRRGWSIELEVARLKLDGGDEAKTGGVSLVKAFGKRRFAPYMLAGGGGGKYEYADGTEQKVRFGEIGAGIMFRKKRFSIGVDVRRGVRAFKDDDDASMMPTTRGSTSPTGDEHEHDHYTRGRVIALINF